MPATPISISSTNDNNLPLGLKKLLNLRLAGDSLLTSVELELELNSLHQGPVFNKVLQSLQETLAFSLCWKEQSTSKLTSAEIARGLFVQAWCLSRIGEYDGTTPEELPSKLKESLAIYEEASNLLNLPNLPNLNEVPSITRRSTHIPPLALSEQEGWVGEFLAEYARTQATLAFSSLLSENEMIHEDVLTELLDLACRRNVQALFTPLSSPSPSDDPAGTVMGNARLIKDMLSVFPFSTSTTTSTWLKRINFATHVADCIFVQSSMSAERLVEAASASATILKGHISPGTGSTAPEGSEGKDKIGPSRNVAEVINVLEATVRRLVPYEKKQAACLLALGRTMLEAVGAIYLGRMVGKEPTAEEADQVEVEVPENDLVRESRGVFIRAAGLFENAYASFRRTPTTSTSTKEEQRLLRRLETTYCLLEELDNNTPDVVSLREDRVERALWINDRLIVLGDSIEGIEEGDESDDEDFDSDEDESERLEGRLEKVSILN